MALFQHDGILLPYQIHFAPFAHDLLLLQGSRFNSDYWLPVLNDWREVEPAGGRVITCDWSPEKMNGAGVAEFFNRFFQTLGLHDLHVVACDDAAQVVQDLERDYPGAVAKTLLFARNAPKGDELKAAVSAFSTK